LNSLNRKRPWEGDEAHHSLQNCQVNGFFEEMQPKGDLSLWGAGTPHPQNDLTDSQSEFPGPENEFSDSENGFPSPDNGRSDSESDFSGSDGGFSGPDNHFPDSEGPLRTQKLTARIRTVTLRTWIITFWT
jgi:hypothetical protein